MLPVDGDASVRSWVSRVLAHSEFRVAEAKELLERRQSDLLLAVYRLGSDDGCEPVHDLRCAGFAGPAVIMTARPERGLNEAASAELPLTLRRVAAGEESVDARHPPRPGGAREHDVLVHVAAGATNREIAALGIGVQTVKTLLARASARLGTRRRAEVVAEATRRGLLR